MGAGATSIVAHNLPRSTRIPELPQPCTTPSATPSPTLYKSPHWPGHGITICTFTLCVPGHDPSVPPQVQRPTPSPTTRTAVSQCHCHLPRHCPRSAPPPPRTSTRLSSQRGPSRQSCRATNPTPHTAPTGRRARLPGPLTGLGPCHSCPGPTPVQRRRRSGGHTDGGVSERGGAWEG